MILVRDVFQLHFGKAREALASIRGLGTRLTEGSAAQGHRVCTDLVGAYYTLVLESTYESLAEYEEDMRMMADPAWQRWYGEFQQYCSGGHREIFTIATL